MSIDLINSSDLYRTGPFLDPFIARHQMHCCIWHTYTVQIRSNSDTARSPQRVRDRMLPPQSGRQKMTRWSRAESLSSTAHRRPLCPRPPRIPCAGLGVNLARIVGALELSAPEHLGVAADRGTIDRLDLEAGVGKGG